MDPDKVHLAAQLAPLIAVVAAICMGAWVITTWMKIKNGYPLENGWGQPLHPKTDREAQERIKLLTQDNAQLRAEIGSIKDRLATVERIVTDDSQRLSREIDALAIGPGGHA